MSSWMSRISIDRSDHIAITLPGILVESHPTLPGHIDLRNSSSDPLPGSRAFSRSITEQREHDVIDGRAYTLQYHRLSVFRYLHDSGDIDHV